MSWPVRIRSAAEQDVADHARYLQERSSEVAIRFLGAVDSSLQMLEQWPNIGSRCQFSQPQFGEVRVWPVAGFKNHLIFYRVLADEIEVVRVLHGARDLGLVFGEEGS